MKRSLVYSAAAAGLAILSLSLTNCSTLGIPPVKDTPASTETALHISGLDRWPERRSELLRLFQSKVYGPWPRARNVEVVSKKVIDKNFLEGIAILEEWAVEIGSVPMTIALAIPANANRMPLVLEANSCGNQSSLRDERLAVPSVAVPGFCNAPGFTDPLAVALMGRHYASPPLEKILNKGFAYVTFHAGEVAPDNSKMAAQAISRIDGDDIGAVMAWAWTYAQLTNLLQSDERFENQTSAIIGHSRFGKAALVAAAHDEEIDIVIAHQSGTLGASLSGDGVGESFMQITNEYPHWFTRRFLSYVDDEASLPVNQHELIALIAPRPVLLGNARRDIWSDPQGAFAAAYAADKVYERLGSEGLEQETLRPSKLDADLSFYMRGGRHGVTTEDWDKFLAFLHFHQE